MNKNIKTVFLFLLVFLVILATVYKGQDFAGKPDEISYSDFFEYGEPIEGKSRLGKLLRKMERIFPPNNKSSLIES